jgi:hypothetical protein
MIQYENSPDVSDALGGFAPAADAAPGCDNNVLLVRRYAQVPTFVPIAMHPVPLGGLVAWEGGCTPAETTSTSDYLPWGMPTRWGQRPQERPTLVKKLTLGCDFIPATHNSPGAHA